MKKIFLILSLLIATPPAFAAFSAIQTATQATGTGSSVAITTSATTQWSLVTVYAKLADNTETLTSITDDKSNSYTILTVLDNGGANRIYMGYGIQTTGGTTAITCNFSSNVASKRCGADEYGGFSASVTNASVFDTSTTGASTGTALAVSTLTPAATGELIVGVGSLASATTWTAGSGFTIYNGSGSVSMRSEYKLSGAATETADFTIAVSKNWAEIAAAFKNTVSSTKPGFIFE